jgi:phosphate ABC transporter permease subunit PstA
VPIGVGAAVYLEEYAKKNWLTDLIEINVTNLAGVPSIVYGLLALGLFVYQFGFGESILTAGLTLSLLILPIVIVSSREALRAVPGHIREAAYAMGATRWQMVSDHLLPYSRGGIMTGIILGMAEAIGQTAPLITIGALTFIAFLPPSAVTGEFPFLSLQWIWSEFTVLPIQMYNWVSRPDKAFQVNAAAAGVILLGMTLLMNGFGHLPALPGAKEDQMVTIDTPSLAARQRPPMTLRRLEGRARNLDFYYGDFKSLKGISMPIYQNKVTALIGPSRAAARAPSCAASTGCTTCIRNRYDGEIILMPDNVNILAKDGRSDRGAHAHRHGVPEAESVSEVDLRERRLRLAGARVRVRSRFSMRRSSRRCGGALWDEAKDRLRTTSPSRCRRPAAAPVHCARAGDRSGTAAVRRADLGARPDRHRQHRGADDRAQVAGDDSDRHPQHAAGGARLGLHGLHVPGRADRVRHHRSDLHQAQAQGN